jgi:hypothetical protein
VLEYRNLELESLPFDLWWFIQLQVIDLPAIDEDLVIILDHGMPNTIPNYTF